MESEKLTKERLTELFELMKSNKQRVRELKGSLELMSVDDIAKKTGKSVQWVYARIKEWDIK